MSLSITATTQDETTLVRVEDEVDVSNASTLRDALDKVLAEAPSRVEVDLAHVPYMDSTGIGVLVGASRRASEAGTTFAIVNPQRNVARVLQMLGVDKELGASA